MSIFNPLEVLGKEVQKQVDAVRCEIERAVKVALLNEMTATGLSRLVVIDPDNSDKYKAALTALQGGK